jgi:hypothetical protein
MLYRDDFQPKGFEIWRGFCSTTHPHRPSCANSRREILPTDRVGAPVVAYRQVQWTRETKTKQSNASRGSAEDIGRHRRVTADLSGDPPTLET